MGKTLSRASRSSATSAVSVRVYSVADGEGGALGRTTERRHELFEQHPPPRNKGRWRLTTATITLIGLNRSAVEGGSTRHH